MTPPADFLSLDAGMHEGYPDALYHARTPGIASKHILDLVDVAPAKYWHYLHAPPVLPEDEKKALRFGRLLHCAVLEPERFEKEQTPRPHFGYCQAHGPSGTSKERGAENKKARTAWLVDHGCPREIAEGLAEDRDDWLASNTISQEEIHMIRGMAQSVRLHPEVTGRLWRGKKELTCKWTDPETGLVCKARPDVYDERDGVILDLKSAYSATPEDFSKACTNLRYHVQDPFYCRAVLEAGGALREDDPFLFVACEKTEPFLCCVFSLVEEAVREGMKQARANMRMFAECLATDRWPGYPTTIQRIGIKPWGYRR